MKRLLFALILAISIHAGFFFIKIKTSSKPEALLKSEPIKITMSYRQIKNNIKEIPETKKTKKLKSVKHAAIKKPVLEKIRKPEPVKKKRTIDKTKIKKKLDIAKKIEPEIEKKTTKEQLPELLPFHPDKLTDPKLKSEPDAMKSHEQKGKLSPLEKTTTAAVIHTKAIPRYKTNPKLVYPRIAKKRGYQGKVILLVIVSKTGTAKKVIISKSCGYSILDKAALKAIQQWLFYPGTRNGKPVEMSVSVPIRFDLK